MGRKRPLTQEEEGDDTMSQPRSRPPKRPRRDDAPSSTSVNHIKGKLRDVTRTLERSKNLPADIRVEKERALAGYKLDLESAEREKRTQQTIKKYHMVRFFGQSYPIAFHAFKCYSDMISGFANQDCVHRAPESHTKT